MRAVADTRVTVKTLNGEISQITTVVENFVYQLPVDAQETATPEKVKRRNYLEGIVIEICPNTNISVRLLIGASCTEALEPKEVI